MFPSPNACRRHIVLPTVCPHIVYFHPPQTYVADMSFYLRSAPHIVCLTHTYIVCFPPQTHVADMSFYIHTVCPPHCMSTPTSIVCLYSHDCNPNAHDPLLARLQSDCTRDCNTTCRVGCKHLHYVMHVIESSMLCCVVGMSYWAQTCYNRHVCLYVYMHVNITTCRVRSNTTCRNQHLGLFVHAWVQHTCYN
jgi:hypothetical protein